jgi:hypothetical protein
LKELDQPSSLVQNLRGGVVKAPEFAGAQNTGRRYYGLSFSGYHILHIKYKSFRHILAFWINHQAMQYGILDVSAIAVNRNVLPLELDGFGSFYSKHRSFLDVIETLKHLWPALPNKKKYKVGREGYLSKLKYLAAREE